LWTRRPFTPKPSANLHEIGVEAGEIFRAADVRFVAEDRVAADAAVETIFPLHDHAEVLVIQDHRLRRDFSMWAVASSWMFITNEPSPSMSMTCLSGRATFRAECGRIAEAHRAEAERLI